MYVPRNLQNRNERDVIWTRLVTVAELLLSLSANQNALRQSDEPIIQLALSAGERLRVSVSGIVDSDWLRVWRRKTFLANHSDTLYNYRVKATFRLRFLGSLFLKGRGQNLEFCQLLHRPDKEYFSFVDRNCCPNSNRSIREKVMSAAKYESQTLCY